MGMDENRITVKDVLSELDYLLAIYNTSLDHYSDSDIRKKPSEEEWSLGQMYVHLIQTALHVYFESVKACLRQTESNPGVEKSAVAKEIFELGGFPPRKIKVPASPEYTPANPQTKVELYAGLQSVLEEAMLLAPQIEAQPEAGTKVSHGRLGALSAMEWFRLAVMHFRHHLTQKQALERYLGLE